MIWSFACIQTVEKVLFRENTPHPLNEVSIVTYSWGWMTPNGTTSNKCPYFLHQWGCWTNGFGPKDSDLQLPKLWSEVGKEMKLKWINVQTTKKYHIDQNSPTNPPHTGWQETLAMLTTELLYRMKLPLQERQFFLPTKKSYPPPDRTPHWYTSRTRGKLMRLLSIDYPPESRRRQWYWRWKSPTINQSSS